MKDNLCLPNKSEIAHEIMAYLAEHPEAQDTIEGILHWWLLERKIKYLTAMVKDAIAELVAKGFVLEHKKSDSQNHYRINQQKSSEIQALLKEWSKMD